MQLGGDEALLAIGAVVGHQVEVVASGLELLLQDDDVLAAETGNNIHLHTGFMESLGGGVSDGAAHAAADDTDALLALDVGGTAQGTDKVADGIALVERTQHIGGQPDFLEDDGDGALLPVITGDGQRHPLGFLVNAENDELTGQSLFGHKGGLNLQQCDGRVQLLLAHDFIHDGSSLHFSARRWDGAPDS